MSRSFTSIVVSARPAMSDNRLISDRKDSLKSQVVSLQTAHSWANAGVLLGDACIGSGVGFEAIKLFG